MRSLSACETSEVSIHAPVKGATAPPTPSRCTVKRFNSRSREGSDGTDLTTFKVKTQVSIHAPVKGATKASVQRLTPLRVFQFTLP